MNSETAGLFDENAESRTFHRLIYGLINTVNEKLSSGEVAELRRLNPDQPGSAAFWKLLADFDENELRQIGGEDRDETEGRWATVFLIIAQTKGLHKVGAPLGIALAIAGFHEQRFVRLLRARDEQMLDEVAKTARFLAAKAESFNVCELADLIASSDRPWAEKFRRSLARGYYYNLI